ncbi:hypothetical protein KKIDH5335_18880 [Vibrio fluvialis]|nr:hypothetical protein KKIDH5335_18880 [Vibrio fluvialis]
MAAAWTPLVAANNNSAAAENNLDMLTHYDFIALLPIVNFDTNVSYCGFPHIYRASRVTTDTYLPWKKGAVA